MIDHLLSIRSWVAMDSRQYLQAYSWFALTSSNTITTNVTKDTTELQVNASSLQAAVVQAAINNDIQTKTLRLYNLQKNSSLLLADLWKRI